MNSKENYRRAKEEYWRLAEMEPDAREAALQALAQQDAGLAASVRRLLELEVRAVSILDRQPDAPPKFLRYTPIREIGRGGMGRVWLAERSDGSFRGRVAIKQIDREHWSDADERRFLRERQILATLDHPHIARLIDGGTDERGRPFLATWFIDGLRITQHCEQHALGLRARLVLLRKVGEAVAYAHRQLIVHRDIKPANILVDADGDPRLLDFGIARMLGEDTVATAAGASPLTLRYAAPEQIRGETTGIAVDVHALGCLMYELIAGAPPYGDANPAALINAILHQEPELPSVVARRLGRAVPSRDLDAICLRALRKRPDDRYRSVDDWIADIDRTLADEPVQARRGERGYAARTWLRRRWPWLAAAVALAAVTTYHVVSINQQLAAVARERDRATELADFAITLYQSATPAEIREEKVSAMALLNRATERMEQTGAQKLKPEIHAALVASLGHIYYEIGVRDRATQQFERAVQLFEQSDPVPEDDLASHQRYVAMSLYDRGQPEAALGWIERALERRERIGDHDSVLRLGLERAAGLYNTTLDRLEPAAMHSERAITLLEQQLPQTRNELAIALGNTADLDMQRGKVDSAGRRLLRARELLDPSNSVFYRNDLFLRRMQSKVLMAQGRQEESLALMLAALVQAREKMGAAHPDVLVFANDYGVLLTRAGRLDEAGVAFDEALALDRAAGADGARRLLGVRAGRARWLLARGDTAGAIEELQFVLQERARTPQRDRRSAALERVALAYAQCLQGDAQARAQLPQLLKEPDAVSVALRPGVAEDFARWREGCAQAAAATAPG